MDQPIPPGLVHIQEHIVMDGSTPLLKLSAPLGASTIFHLWGTTRQGGTTSEATNKELTQKLIWAVYSTLHVGGYGQWTKLRRWAESCAGTLYQDRLDLVEPAQRTRPSKPADVEAAV